MTDRRACSISNSARMSILTSSRRTACRASRDRPRSCSRACFPGCGCRARASNPPSATAPGVETTLGLASHFHPQTGGQPPRPFLLEQQLPDRRRRSSTLGGRLISLDQVPAIFTNSWAARGSPKTPSRLLPKNPPVREGGGVAWSLGGGSPCRSTYCLVAIVLRPGPE